jgi:hypothetical protein
VYPINFSRRLGVNPRIADSPSEKGIETQLLRAEIVDEMRKR